MRSWYWGLILFQNENFKINCIVSLQHNEHLWFNECFCHLYTVFELWYLVLSNSFGLSVSYRHQWGAGINSPPAAVTRPCHRGEASVTNG